MVKSVVPGTGQGTMIVSVSFDAAGLETKKLFGREDPVPADQTGDLGSQGEKRDQVDGAQQAQEEPAGSNILGELDMGPIKPPGDPGKG